MPTSHGADTMPAWLAAISKAFGDRACVRADTETITYAELDRRSAALARGLLARGIGKGSRIGALFGNGPEWAIWFAATTRIGAVFVPMSTFFQPAELNRVIRHADLHGLVATRHFLNRDFEAVLTETFPQLADADGGTVALVDAPYLRWVSIAGSDAAWSHDPTWFLEAGAGAPWGEVLAAAEAEVHPDDEALFVYTSGQSADPKAVVHSHGALMVKTQYLHDMFRFTAATETAITYPFFWVGGLTMGLLPTLDAGGICSCTERSTWGSGGIVGSTKAFADPFTHFRKSPALGMTETLGIYSWGDAFRVEGHPMSSPIDELQPGFEMKLIGPDGEVVTGDGSGEILLRGPSVAVRLHKVARSDTFDPDGFYRTGDRGMREGERVHFIGRIRDMIKTSGANVSPAEVERELNALDGVAVAHVVALPDRKRDQIVAAAVVPEDGARLDAEAIRSQLRERLSAYKVPRVIVFLPSANDVPMTPSLKVRKPELVALIRALTDGPDDR